MPQYFVHDGEDERLWSVERDADGNLQVTDADGKLHSVDVYTPEPGRLHILRDGRSCDMDVRMDKDGYHVQWRAHSTTVDVVNERQHRMEGSRRWRSRSRGSRPC